MVEKAILQFERFTKYVDFGRFDQKQAIAYKTYLADSGLAKSTILTRLTYLKRFLRWLSRQNGYKRRVLVDNVEYLSLPEKDIRAVTSTPQKPFPTLAMVKRAIFAMPHDPLFPKIPTQRDKGSDELSKDLSRECWKTTTLLREIFKAAFEAVGLPYYKPHSFRDMIVDKGYSRNLSVQDFKAWSANLGHKNPQTTLTSYGQLSDYDMERIIRGGRN